MSKPKTYLRYKIIPLEGKSIGRDGNIYYVTPEQADMFAPTPSFIKKVWVTETEV